MEHPAPEAPEPPPRRSPRPAKRGHGRAARVGALAALAVAGGLLAWVLVDRSDSDQSAQATTAPSVTTTAATAPAETVSQPAFQTIAELRAAAAISSNPIYWAGARAGTQLEVSQTSGGTVFVRYLPTGTTAGDTQPHLTVATYARANGYAEVQAAAKNEDSRSLELDGGGLAVYDPGGAGNVHLAFPGQPYQIEVFSPEDDLALRLVTNGKIRRFRRDARAGEEAPS